MNGKGAGMHLSVPILHMRAAHILRWRAFGLSASNKLITCPLCGNLNGWLRQPDIDSLAAFDGRIPRIRPAHQQESNRGGLCMLVGCLEVFMR